MADERPEAHSGVGADSPKGLLFRLGARAGALLFVGVLSLALTTGMEPTIALVRALIALLALVTCGWAAERVAGSHRQAEAVDAPDAETSLPGEADTATMTPAPATAD